MKLHENSQLRLPPYATKVSSKAVSFHPIQSKICVALRKDIIEYDIHGSQISHFTTSSEVTHLAHAITHNVLVAALKNGCFCVWELSNSTLSSYHIPSSRELRKRHRQVMCMAVGSTSPVIFFARLKSPVVQGIEMFSSSRGIVYKHKKYVTTITTHPSKPLMASASIDGVIKVWNTENHSVKFTLDANFAGDGVKKKKILASPVTALTFNDKDMLLSATKDGRVICWDLSGDKEKVIGMNETGKWITSVQFHPTLPCILILDDQGTVSAFSISHIIHNTNLKRWLPMFQFDMIENFNVPLYERKYMSEKKFEHLIPFINMVVHDKAPGYVAFYGKQLNFQSSGYFPVFCISDQYNPLSTLPICSPLKISMETFTKENIEQTDKPSTDGPEYTIPENRIYFIDSRSAAPNYVLKAYELTTKESTSVQLIKPSQSTDEFHRCIRMKFNKSKTSVLTFFETLQLKVGADKYHFLKTNIKVKEIPPLQTGMDGDFLGETDDFIILDGSGKFVTIFRENKPEKYPLKCTVARIFCSPYDEKSIIYFNSDGGALGYATPSDAPNYADKLQFNPSRYFFMREHEIPLSIVWQKDETSSDSCLLGLLTSHRVVILSPDLRMLACVEAPRNKISHFQSCIWLGNVLIYNTSTNVYALIVGAVEPTHICTLDYPNTVLCGILADRIIFTCEQDNQIRISYRYVRILEPLLMCILSIPSTKITYEKQLHLLKMVTSRFDCKNISIPTLSLLEKKGFAQLACQLALQSQYQLPWNLKFRLAKSSLDFAKAFEILQTQFFEDAYEDEYVTEDSEYFSYFSELAKTSLDYGQFDIACKCFDLINDAWALFRIFSCDNNITGLQLLAKRCLNSYDLYNVYVACQIALGQGDKLEESANSQDKHTRTELRVPIENWPLKVDEIVFDLTEESYKGKMRVAKDQVEEKEDVEEPQIGTPGDIYEISKFSITDLAKWMGTTQIVSSKSPTEDLSKLDFTAEGFGKEDQPGGTDVSPDDAIEAVTVGGQSDEESISDETSNQTRSTTRGDALQPPGKAKDTIKLPPVPQIAKSPSSTSLSSDKQESRKDTATATSDASDTSDSDDEEDEFDRKTRILKKVRILDKAVKKENEDNKIENFGLKLGGLGLASPPTSARSRRVSTRPPPARGVPPISVTTPSNVQKPTIDDDKDDSKEPKTIINPATCLKAGIAAMEKGDYSEALKQTNTAISALVRDNSQILSKNNIMLCVRYKLLIAMLSHLRRLEKAKKVGPAEAAMLSLFLSGIPVPNAKHRVTCKNMAIKRNMDANNFGTAARLIKELLPITPPQYKDMMNSKLKQCEEKGFQDANKVQEGTKYCWRTYQVIKQPSWLKCSYCDALYIPSETIVVQKTCSFCSYGKLETATSS